MRDGRITPNNPMEKNSSTISAGLGYSLGRNAALDLTYLYSAMDYTRYDMFFFENGHEEGPQTVELAGFDLERHRHRIMLGLKMRF